MAQGPAQVLGSGLLAPVPLVFESLFAVGECGGEQLHDSVQEHFVDGPDRAVGEADRLVTTLMSECGYPTESYEQQKRDLSVERSRTLEHYRVAHEINGRVGRRDTSTEELRSAMVHYRALFEELLHNGTPSSDAGRR